MTKAESNRANAQHSTGPKTPEGKHRSSLNALRHGLTGQIVVMPHEDLAAYQRHVKALNDEYNPQGHTEALLVQALADATWRLNRVASTEATLQAVAAANHSDPIQEAIAASTASQSKGMSSLSIHGERLSRQFERSLRQLRELQKIRRSQEAQDLSDLLNIMQMYKSKGQTYIPANGGFVFSTQQINAAKQARNRQRLAQEALAYVQAASRFGNGAATFGSGRAAPTI
jgi:hypothetical protein